VKLGIKAGMTGARVNRCLVGKKAAGALDFIHCFATTRRMLATRFAALEPALAPAGALWVSWPKGGAAVATDLTENVVREIGLAHGLVDVKVCAVDETWSALKFVRRLKDR